MSDMPYLISIICIFVTVGLFLPFVNNAIGEASSVYDLEEFSTKPTIADVITGNIVLSVLSMFFWTFGALPFWLEAIFITLRILAIIIGIRMLRGVG